ncbi:pilus assembly protein [Coralloluteibacterium stylophorae]|uniref:Pilus assembly protein n=1 Tax=Coralloluteibacterium stylophorae TaxID=1776034 RepID=A0A8J7VTL3_9GAMM|nr:PilC/PilY family type IV pilus protein [Coralloluteibacterium stylophorae]MBS7456662.1 pilus assembly protein [Coralloluteibacterium stylophorae]
MASHKSGPIVASVAACLGVLAAGYAGYAAYAAQARPGAVLAQAPLNVEVQVPPAFIMALDDSGSMNWETMNNTRDGAFTWARATNNSSVIRSFFDTNGVPFGYSGGYSRTTNYLFVFPYPGRNNDQNAIPPTTNFGFARSHEFNPAYFNPGTTYEPWKNADGSVYANVDPANAPVDPRPAGVNNKINYRVDLTAPLEETDGGWLFQMRTDMVLPAGTRHWLNGCGGSRPGPNRTWYTHGSDVRFSSDCDIAISFYPATYYLTVPNSPDGYSGTPLPVVNPVGGPPDTTLYRYEIRRSNYPSQELYARAIQNFANWFTYYRTRREALISGLTNSLLDVQNMRVGWFLMNVRDNVTMYDLTDPDEKEDLFEGLYKIPASGNTPSRRAVDHLGKQFQRSGNNAPVQLTCQRNAGMLFTDGYINDTSSPSSTLQDDGLGAPFEDKVPNTMADIVLPYYLESLRPGGFDTNNVPVPSGCSADNPDPRLDCQTNLHMNFYGITLGTLGNLYGDEYQQDPEQPWVVNPSPFDQPPSWHTSRVDLSPHAVDEMWHATINARGEMINASTPEAITLAMRRILASVPGAATPSGTLAMSGARVGAGSLSVSPTYEARDEGTDWFSTLTAQRVRTNTAGTATEFQYLWEAAAAMPAAASRDVYATKGGTVVRFNAANISLDDVCTKPDGLYPGMVRCTSGEIAALGVDRTQAVNYLLGDRTLERSGDTGKLRKRSSRLGDIVNSTPVISSPDDDYGYGSLPAPYGTSYRTYLNTTKQSRRYMVYAGANDGMLHAFDGGMDADNQVGGSGGREEFAYVPATALGHMGNLLFPYEPDNRSDQKFSHRYYVDGPVTVSDAYVGNAWETVLVGTAGAGGRGVFALNVSDPANFDPADRLWEISDLDASLSDAVRANIGHVLGRPVIVPVKSDGVVRWKAIFGNGYNSASGKAVLFVVDIASGAPSITMIEAVEAGAGVPAGSNGLGNIVVVDRWGPDGANQLNGIVRDGFADTVYAADQKGALWKFDLRSSAPATVTTPVFTTRSFVEGGQTYRQPIIGGMTAAAGPNAGVMLYFGSGSFSFQGDPDDRSVQSLYAVNDTVRGSVTSSLSRGNLQGYSVGGGATERSISMTGSGPSFASGWYVDLPAGERFVGYPRIASGIVFMPTYAPQDGSAGCSTNGSNWLFGLNASSGAAALSNARYGSPSGNNPSEGTASVILNTGGTAPVKDVGVNVLPRLQPGAPDDLSAPGAPPSTPEQGCWMTVTTAGLVEPLYLPYPCGRQSWRQVE